MSKPPIAILRAGLAGLSAAWQLTRCGLAYAFVLERSSDVGGNAGSFELCWVPVDYRSHRLYPACNPYILDDVRILLGEDMLMRPRHGRIRLTGRLIHFPLKASDLLTNLPWGFRLRIAGDIMRKVIPTPSNDKPLSFASILKRGLGRTICQEFYFPYAQKIWGSPPEELSPIQAHRRVSTRSLGKMLRKALTGGKKSSGTKGCFFYPRGGIGQIVRAMATSAREAGTEICLKTAIRAIRIGLHWIEFRY